MSNKFSEEQYHKIVEIGEKYRDDRRRKTDVLLECMYDDFGFNGLATQPLDKAFALANPVTREWAHEQFVEKEKKYVWTSKKPYYEDFYKRLYMASNGLSKGVNGIGIAAYEKLNVSEDEYLTETEVRNNGYNPEWFDKEEV